MTPGPLTRPALDVFGPLDAARRATLRALRPWVAPLVVDRQRRVLWLGLLSVAVALGTTLAAPALVLAAGPLVLGVPHLVADLRYLVARPGLHRRVAGWLLAPSLVAAVAGAPPAYALLGLLPAAILSSGPPRRAAVIGAAGMGVIAAAWRWPWEAQWALLHGHNLVALGLWWRWRARPASHALVPALTVAAAAALLAGGDALVGTRWAPSGASSFAELAEQLAPGLAAPWAARVVVCFCFLQGVHYALWLRLVPDDARRRPAPRSFRASWAALGEDLGRPLVWAAALAWLSLLAWGAVAPGAARLGYLQLAAWHAYLELFVVAGWWADGRRPSETAA